MKKDFFKLEEKKTKKGLLLEKIENKLPAKRNRSNKGIMKSQHNNKKFITNGLYIGSIKKLSKDWKYRFLSKLAETGSFRLAIEYANINRRYFDELRKLDPEFEYQIKCAKQDYLDIIKEEIDRRGRQGYNEPVFYKGKQTATVRKYSDDLLKTRGSIEAPEEFGREKSVDNNNQVNVQVVLGFKDEDGVFSVEQE